MTSLIGEMKGFLIYISIVVLSTQCLRGQNRFGFVGGPIYAKSNLTDQNQAGLLSESTSRFGNIYSFYGGVVFDQRLSSEFSIKYKLLYINKGWKELRNIKRFTIDSITAVVNPGTVKLPSESIESSESVRLKYLELPILFTFYTPIGKTQLNFSVGPYLSFGLAGRYRSKAISSEKHTYLYRNGFDTIRQVTVQPVYAAGGIFVRNDTSRVSIPIQVKEATLIDTSNYIKNFDAPLSLQTSRLSNGLFSAFRFDYGFAIEAGLQLRSGLFFNLNYGLGITNIMTGYYGSVQNRNRVLTVGIGYYLKRKMKKDR